MKPSFDLDKIKFATDPVSFEKAVALYEKGKIKNFEEGMGTYSAIVEGGQFYHVSVEARRFGYGHCNCYLGEKDTLCKHMVALSIFSVLGGKSIPQECKKLDDMPKSSGRPGNLSEDELREAKKSISDSIKYIKPYAGPSRTWFAYQNSLSEGCHRLSAIISRLPVCATSADLIVSLLLRLDKKLCVGGVDDSDGTVGGLMEGVVRVLENYAKLDASCIKSFEKLRGQDTCFGWEESLIKLL